MEIDVVFYGRYLQPTSASLLFVARGGRATSGSTLSFKLEAVVTAAKPQVWGNN